MVELLSRDNVALREKLESLYLKMNSMQMVRKREKTGKLKFLASKMQTSSLPFIENGEKQFKLF